VVDDLGAQGEWPTHPELLDWLSVEFRQSGWDVKHLVKLIVLSATYRQDSNLRPELRDSDPNNRLLASQNPRRLEAEFVRDNACLSPACSNPDRGRPSIRPINRRFYAQLQFPDPRYQAQLVTGSIGAEFTRTGSAPSSIRCWRTLTRRGARMHRPPHRLHPRKQALTLLNRATFVEASRVLPKNCSTRRKPMTGRASICLREGALARPANRRKRKSLTAFLAGTAQILSSHPADRGQAFGKSASLPPRHLNKADWRPGPWWPRHPEFDETITKY